MRRRKKGGSLEGGGGGMHKSECHVLRFGPLLTPVFCSRARSPPETLDPSPFGLLTRGAGITC